MLINKFKDVYNLNQNVCIWHIVFDGNAVLPIRLLDYKVHIYSFPRAVKSRRFVSGPQPTRPIGIAITISRDLLQTVIMLYIKHKAKQAHDGGTSEHVDLFLHTQIQKKQHTNTQIRNSTNKVFGIIKLTRWS